MKVIAMLAALSLTASAAAAQELPRKVNNVEVLDLDGKPAKLPYWGEKNLMLDLSVVGDSDPNLLELPHRLGHGRVRIGEVLAYDLPVRSGGVGEAETSSVWVARLEVGDLEADSRLGAPDFSGKKLDLGVAVVPVLPGKGRTQVEGERMRVS